MEIQTRGIKQTWDGYIYLVIGLMLTGLFLFLSIVVFIFLHGIHIAFIFGIIIGGIFLFLARHELVYHKYLLSNDNLKHYYKNRLVNDIRFNQIKTIASTEFAYPISNLFVGRHQAFYIILKDGNNICFDTQDYASKENLILIFNHIIKHHKKVKIIDKLNWI